MPVNKLDEPLDGNDFSSSFRIIGLIDFLQGVDDYIKNLKFHIRINFTNQLNELNLGGFHYIALLIGKFDKLIQNKRLSFFLVPRTSSTYPYEKDGLVDTDLFYIASMQLRALIGEGKKGIIYGVPNKKIGNSNIVKALDFKIKSKGKNNFPLIFLDGNTIYEKDDENKYSQSVKDGNYLLRNDDISIKSINNYSLLFKNQIAYQYLGLAKHLKENQRFGFADNKNPNLALCDYIFETAYNILKSKAISADIPIDRLISCLPIEFEKSNIFSFAIFSFILNLSKNLEIAEYNLKLELKNYFLLSSKISSGVEQIIQNSIQHSSRKLCVISFYKINHELKIMISDVSKKAILDTFNENLESENQFLEENLCSSEIFSTLAQNIAYYKKASYEGLKEGLSLKCFFNDFNSIKDENGILESWLEFRQSDSSAHIGMSLFANAVKRCGGNFSLISCSNDIVNIQDDKNFYSTLNLKEPETIAHFPGTEYIVTLPTIKKSASDISNVVQLNNTNYSENYDSFAEFIDYEIENLNYEIDRKYLNETYIKAKSLKIENAINKFSSQIMWTNYWLNIFEHINITQNKIYCIDYSKVGINQRFLEKSYAKETIIKGLLDALSIFASKNSNEKLYIALVNTNPAFLALLEEISFSLSLKLFPNNVQLFISDQNEDIQIHLVGNHYGQAIQNAYLLSLENYYKSYDGSTYYDVDLILRPFYNIMNSQENKEHVENKKTVNIVPFSGILHSNFHEKSMFFSKINIIANKDIITENGYKLNHNHTRLGNKVHIDSFYEMSHLFHRTVVANHVAFLIIRELKNKGQLNILEDQILFYGYASYSQAILMSLTKTLESYRSLHEQTDAENKISYSIYQYNLQYEANSKDIKLYLSNPNLSKYSDTINVIQIVPISSTLTTFAKMWKKLKQENDFGEKLSLNDNFTVFWVRDIEESPRAKDENGNTLNVSELESKYFSVDDNGEIISRFSALGERNSINRILTGEAKWEKPEICSQCFPPINLLEEIPIIETDPTSTVPSQQIYSNDLHERNQKMILSPLDEKSVNKYTKLYGNIFYGHYKRGKNHYQFFIDTQSYFAAVSSEIITWLKSLRENDEKYKTNLPTIDIIFSPSHNTNVGFSQYVNAYYFNGSAEIISINEDKEFNSNFNCEYAMLKNTIQRLVDDYLVTISENGVDPAKCDYRPVRFIFVDDNIITGDSFRKASKLLQSLLPEKIIENYGTNVFEKCFVLIDRMSHTSRESYILPKENYYAFCEINVSSMRKQGDSCVCCKLKKQMNSLHNRSSTRYSCDYWEAKKVVLQEQSFETIQKDNISLKRKAYLRMMFSHIIKNFMCNDINNNFVIFDKLLLLFDYFSENVYEKRYNNELLNYLKSYMPVLIEPYSNDFESNFNKDSIVNMIKIISRPFFVYDQNIKQEILHFLIILCDTTISSEGKLQNLNESYQKAEVISRNIIKMFKEPLELLDFLQNVVLDALTDLHSTYLLRSKTIRKILVYINSIYSANSKNAEFEENIKAFFFALFLMRAPIG